MSVFLIGDTHGVIDLGKITLFNSYMSKLTKNDYLIVLGDFGVVWDNDVSDHELTLIEFYNNLSFTTLFVDGNHENHERLKTLPRITMFGNDVGVVSDSIFHLLRGNVYDIDNLKLLTIGGASSVDRNYRTEFIDWWSSELLSFRDINNCLDNLDIVDNNVDYILTHTCPESIGDLLELSFINVDSNMKFFEQLTNSVKFKHWFFGHFHIDVRVNDKFTCVYKTVIQLI